MILRAFASYGTCQILPVLNFRTFWGSQGFLQGFQRPVELCKQTPTFQIIVQNGTNFPTLLQCHLLARAKSDKYHII